jgi:hypothetical protein
MSTPTFRSERVKKSHGKRLALIVGLVAVGVFAYFAFRTLRGLMMLGYVDSAILRLRVISAAEAEFSKAHPALGYTCMLSQLPRSDVIARLLAKDRIDNGYVFEIAGCQSPVPAKPNSIYYITARPLHSEQPAFCSDQSGVVKADATGSVQNCLARGVPL